MSKEFSYKDIITIEPGKRGGQPTIRGMRITVYDILKMLASGMTYNEILTDFPELNESDILASLKYASDREKSTILIDYETSTRSKSVSQDAKKPK